jgi:hypothetical protein
MSADLRTEAGGDGDRDDGEDGDESGGGGRNGEEPRRPSGQPFFFNRELLAPDVSVPVPLVVNDKRGFQAVVRDLLVRCGGPAVSVEPAVVTLGAMLFGCQEVVAGCQDLIASPAAREVGAACDRILSGCREVSGHLEGAYVILQAVEGSRPAGEGGDAVEELRCARLKDLSGHLERFFRSGRIATGMDLGRLAVLEVRLDEIFDECCRQLERFYHAALHRHAPRVFVEFARGFYHAVFTRIVPDHLFDPVRNAAAGGEERSGLLDLLPELKESLRRNGA